LPTIPDPIQKWLPDEFKPFFLELSAGGNVSKSTKKEVRNDGLIITKDDNKGNFYIKLFGGVKLGLSTESKALNSKAALEGKGGIAGGFDMDLEKDVKACPNGYKVTFQRSPVVFKASLELAVQVGVLGFGVGPYEFEKQMITEKKYPATCLNTK
jgi:hypothetical protein